MRRRGVSAALASLVVVCTLWGVWLLAATIHNPAPGRESAECGSAVAVIRNGTAYVGGEMVTDQAGFDRTCLGLAHHHVRLALVAGGVAMVALAAVVALTASDPRRSVRPTPATYTFTR